MLSWCVQELNYKEDPEDGLFWMDKNDFFNHYWTMSVCMVNTNGRVSADKLADKRQAVVSKDKPQAGKLVEARMVAAYKGNLERTKVGSEDEGKLRLQQNPTSIWVCLWRRMYLFGRQRMLLRPYVGKRRVDTPDR